MSLAGVIAAFTTGTYTVTRTASGEYVDGRYTAGSASTFEIVACIQPAGGRALQVLAESERTEEIRVLYTESILRTRGTGEADTVSIDSETWKVIRVDRWQAFGGDESGSHYRVLVSRIPVP